MTALLQTLLWVVLIVWALLRFEKVISGLLSAVTKRIEDGDELAGPGGFRIGVRQTPAGEQRHRLQEEAQEVIRNVLPEEGDPPAPSAQRHQEDRAEQEPANQFPSIKNALGKAVRDVSDAQTLGLKWLGMTEGGQVVPDVMLGNTAFDGLLKRPDGSAQALVMVKLVNNVSQIATIVEQAKSWFQARPSSGKYAQLPIAVVLVTSDHFDSSISLWHHLPINMIGDAKWYQIDLRQLRSMYGLEV